MRRHARMVSSLVAAFALVAGLLTVVPSWAGAVVRATAEALGGTTSYACDALDHVVSTSDALAGVSASTSDGDSCLTNHLARGTDVNGDVSAYTFNALFQRVNLTQISHAGQVYSRDYVNDVVVDPRDELVVYAADFTQTRA